MTLQCQRGSCPAPRKSTAVKGLPLTVDPLEKEGPPHVHAAGHVHVYMHVGRCAVLCVSGVARNVVRKIPHYKNREYWPFKHHHK